MISRNKKPDLLRRRGAATAAAAAGMGLLIGLSTTGCGPKQAATPPATAPQAAPAGGGTAPAVKLTPEQEAAKQRAIQQGPAIEAALRRQQQGQ